VFIYEKPFSPDFNQRTSSITHTPTATMKSYAIAVVAGALATTVAGTPATPVQKRADVTTITVKGNGAFAEKQGSS
jgi:hypothetical protein